jgi:hypothetical protein
VIDALLDQFGVLLVLLDPAQSRRINGFLDKLEEYLLLGNSAWALAPDRKGLTNRVDLTAAAAVAQAVAPQDAASDELAEAWRKAYGREPDSSDAWDHSIKAVEHILKPVISPKNNISTLGTIIRDLKAGRQNFQMLLSHKDGNEVDRLIGMLELMWPNPDRHGGATAAAVTLDQAQAVVHLAVTIVQWGRTGVLWRLP